MELLLVNSLQKIFCDTKDFQKISTATCLGNDEYNLQIVVKTTAKCELNIKLNTSLNFDLYRVDELQGSVKLPKNNDGYFLSTESKLYPEVLRDSSGKEAAREGLNTYWVTVHPQNMSGMHEIEVIVTSNGETCCAKLSLEVIAAELVENDLIVTRWVHYDSISDQHKVDLFSDKFYNVFKNILENYIGAGHTMLYIPLFTPPLDTYIGGQRQTAQLVDVVKNKGNYIFNLDKLKNFLAFAKENGVKYYEMSHFFTQWGAKHCPKIMATVDGVEKQIFGWKNSSISAGYKKFMSAFLAELTAFLTDNNYLDYTYVHISDEPYKTAYKRYSKLSKFMRKNAPSLKIMDALSDYKFYENKLLDLPVVAVNHAKPFLDAKADMMVYYCVSQTDKNVPNAFFAMPSLRNRILGIMLYESECKGFLHWGYNFYNTQLSKAKINPYEVTDSGGNFPSGDAFQVYPYKDTVLSSLRLKVFSDAINDYRALKTLESRTSRTTVIKMIETLGVSGFEVYPKDEIAFLNFRNLVNIAIKGTL